MLDEKAKALKKYIEDNKPYFVGVIKFWIAKLPGGVYHCKEAILYGSSLMRVTKDGMLTNRGCHADSPQVLEDLPIEALLELTQFVREQVIRMEAQESVARIAK